MGTHYQGKASEVRVLDALIKLVRCASSLQERLSERLRLQGFTENQFGVLEILLHLGPLEPCDLGVKLFTSRPNVSALLDQLEERGLVTRDRSEVDRRRVTVRLTPQGRRLIERGFPEHLATLLEEFSVLQPREQEELARLCRALGRHEKPR